MLKRTNLVKSRFNLKDFNSNFFPVAFMSFFVFAQIFDGVNAFGIKWVSGVLLVILVAFHALRSKKIITKNKCFKILAPKLSSISASVVRLLFI